MKKTSMLAALALVVTIGGAYATWNYAGTKVDTVTSEKSISITDATTTTEHGVIHVHSSTLTLSLDDIGGYTPGWNPTVNESNGGNLAIDFVPNAGAPNELTFSYTITITGNVYNDDVHGDVPIFSEIAGEDATADGKGTLVASTSVTLDLTQASTNPGGCVGAYLIESWTAKNIMDLLVVNNGYTIDTLEEYNEFKENLKNVKIVVTVNDTTPQNS